MDGMPWVKIDTEILDDPKMAKLDESVKWRFIQLILLAGKCDAEGFIVQGDTPMTNEDISWRLRIDESVLEKDLQILSERNLIEFSEKEKAWLVINFSKRQGRSQTEKRTQWRDRQREHRKRIKDQEESPANVIGDCGNVTGDNNFVTPLEREEEKEGEREREGESSLSVASNKFEEEIGALTPMIGEQIGDWVDNYPLVWVTDAMDIASGKQKRNVGYINGILKNWKLDGRGDNSGGKKEHGVDSIDPEEQRKEDAKRSRERIEKGKKVKG